MRHFNILSTVLALLIGVWAVFYFQQKSRRFPDSRLRYLLGFMILYNLIELESFFVVYFKSNLTSRQLGNIILMLKSIDWPLRSLLILGSYFFLYKMIAWLREKKLPKWFAPALFLFMASAMGLFLLAMRFPAYMPKSPLLNFWNLYVWPLNLLELAWLVRLHTANRHDSDPDRKRSDKAFARLFLGLILMQLFLLVLNEFPYYYLTISLAKVLILVTNLIPVFWLKFYFTPWAGSLGKIIGRRIDLRSLQKKHGLSARELEVFELVIDGKSYKQMEESLFISIHTVKSHVYSLYRKMNVKNRHQLTHLVSTLQQENS